MEKKYLELMMVAVFMGALFMLSMMSISVASAIPCSLEQKNVYDADLAVCISTYAPFTSAMDICVSQAQHLYAARVAHYCYDDDVEYCIALRWYYFEPAYIQCMANAGGFPPLEYFCDTTFTQEEAEAEDYCEATYG